MLRITTLILVSLLSTVTLGCDDGRPRGPSVDSSLSDAATDVGMDPDVGGGGDTALPADDGAVDAEVDADALPMASCPPTGPFGTDVGDVAPDVTLLDCEGTEVRLHELCDAPVSWIYHYAEWCPVCRDFAPSAQMLYERHQADGLAAFIIISADGDFGAPDAALCAEVRMRYGFTMPVLYDATGAFASGLEAPTNAYNLIMTRGMEIVWEGHYADASVEGELAAAFAR